MKPIVLADNQEITRAGLHYLCEKMSGSHPVYEIFSCAGLLHYLSSDPDGVVVLDYTLFDLHGVEDLLILQARFHQTAWILFSENLTSDFIRRVIYSSPLFSVILKDSPLDQIRLAMQAAFRSEQFICPRVRQLLNAPRETVAEKEKMVLTTTEIEILKLMALGKSTKGIAGIRFSSTHTIMTHRKNIFRKLEVNNVHEATKYAFRAGIVDASDYYI